MAQYDGSIRINTKIDTKSASAQLMALENRIVKTADRIASLRSKMDSLKNAKIPTQEYKEVSAQIQKAEIEFDKLCEKQRQMKREGKDSGSAWENINAKLEEVGNTIRYARGELKDLVETGKAFTLGTDTEQYAKLGQQLRYAENELSVLNQRHIELNSKQKKNIDGYKQLGKAAKDSAKVASKSVKSVNDVLRGGFKNILKYGLGIRSIYVLVNKLRSGIKEGFSNLYKDMGIPSFKNQVDSLQASLLTLKNSFAAAFRPLVEVAIPYIQMAADAMSDFLDQIGQFGAAIRGQKTYIKAIKQTTAAIKDEGKAQDKQLSSLDKLNNLTSESAAGGGAESGVQMFEEAEIDDSILEVGEKIKGAIDSFREAIQEVGDLIKNEDWEGLGNYISEWITGVIERANESIRSFDWTGTGEKVGTFFKGVDPETALEVLKNIDFKKIIKDINELNSSLKNAALDFFKGFAKGSGLEDKFNEVKVNAKNTFDYIKKRAEFSWNGVKTAFGPIGSWFKENFEEAKENAKNTFKYIRGRAEFSINGVKTAFGNIGPWFKEKFEEAKTNVKNVFTDFPTLAKNARESVNEKFQNIGSWFKEKFTSAYANAKSPFSGAKEYFSGVSSNIKGVFGNIPGWFRDKFTEAWTAVKNVFSTGGKVFDGIKDGILSGLKAVVNALIDGINKVVKIPFDGINSALTTLKSFSIAGAKPFSFLPNISVPQIPRLATGTVIPPNREFLAVLGDQKHGTNIEAPLDTIKQANKEAFLEVLSKFGFSAGSSRSSGNETFVFQIDGRTFFEITRKEAQEYFDRTGMSAFPF